MFLYPFSLECIPFVLVSKRIYNSGPEKNSGISMYGLIMIYLELARVPLSISAEIRNNPRSLGLTDISDRSDRCGSQPKAPFGCAHFPSHYKKEAFWGKKVFQTHFFSSIFNLAN